MHDSAVLQSRLRVAMGTFVAIEAEAGSDGAALQGIEAAYEAVLRVQRLMHPLHGIDLAALAAQPPGTALTVHPWTWQVLRLCKQLHHASKGIFDPCIPQAGGRLGDLRLLAASKVIVQAPLQIDLGGIAKGYAVDRACDALRAAQCSGGLVNAGGDLAVFGRRVRRIACVTGTDSVLIELCNEALATSSTFSDDRPAEHRGYYDGRAPHLAATISGGVSVVAAQAAIADGLTKCLLIVPRGSSAALLQNFGAQLVAARTPTPVLDRSG